MDSGQLLQASVNLSLFPVRQQTMNGNLNVSVAQSISLTVDDMGPFIVDVRKAFEEISKRYGKSLD